MSTSYLVKWKLFLRNAKTFIILLALLSFFSHLYFVLGNCYSNPKHTISVCSEMRNFSYSEDGWETINHRWVLCPLLQKPYLPNWKTYLKSNIGEFTKKKPLFFQKWSGVYSLKFERKIVCFGKVFQFARCRNGWFSIFLGYLMLYIFTDWRKTSTGGATIIDSFPTSTFSLQVPKTKYRWKIQPVEEVDRL